MPPPNEFDINITLSDLTLAWPTFPAQSPSQLPQPNEDDEFDLDFKYLDSTDPQLNQPLPLAADEVLPVGSGFFGITCSPTCTVLGTCHNTCGVTCPNTCQVLATCGHTCQVIVTCAPCNVGPIGTKPIPTGPACISTDICAGS